MSDPVLLARIEPAEGGMVRVLAPCVGWWCDPPHGGAWVGPGSRIGTVRQLNRRYRLVLPKGAAGRVTDSRGSHHVNAVEYGALLFELLPIEQTTDDGASENRSVLGHPPGAGLSEDQVAVVSPTDGVFYSRAAPDAPPFVEPGSRIRLGQPVGLVEVMKTFNQILYEGPGFPEEAEVLEVRAADASEVRAGQVLLVVR
jgi:biotin carboxyl carrier protein